MINDVLATSLRRASEKHVFRTQQLFRAGLNCSAVYHIAKRQKAEDATESDSDEDAAKPAGVERIDMERPSRRTVVDALAAIATFFVETPRFVFVCGSDGRVLRSGDRCRTWRRMALAGDDSAADAYANANDDDNVLADPAEAPKKNDLVADIIARLPARSRSIASKSLGSAARASSPPAAGHAVAAAKKTREKDKIAGLDLLAVSADSSGSGHVVVCGTRGALFYSVNRGQVFQPVALDAAVADATGSDSDAEIDDTSSTSSAGSMRTLRNAVLVRPGVVVFSAGPRAVVATLALDNAGKGGMLPCRITVLVTAAKAVAHIARTRQSDEVVVCAPNVLYMCRIAADDVTRSTAVEVKHGLGTILAAQELPPSTAAAAVPPQPLKPAIAVSQRSGPSSASAAKTNFSYACSTPVGAVAAASLLGSMGAVRCKPPSAATVIDGAEYVGDRARLFAVYCAAGRVVPYDCTATLWLWPNADASEIVASASAVDYMPFVQSNARSDRVGIAATGPNATRWTRSSAGGIATSTDCGATWSNAQLAYTGRVVVLDDDEVGVASMKPAIATLARREVGEKSTVGAKKFVPAAPVRVVTDEWQLHPLPQALRMAVLHDCCVMR